MEGNFIFNKEEVFMKKKLFCMILVFSMIIPTLVIPAAEVSVSTSGVNGDTTTEPTCSDTGEKSRRRYLCYESQTQTIPATGDHLWDDWYTVKKPTIHKTGLKQRECLECYKRQSKKTAKLKPYVKFTKKTVKLKSLKNLQTENKICKR